MLFKIVLIISEAQDTILVIESPLYPFSFRNIPVILCERGIVISILFREVK